MASAKLDVSVRLENTAAVLQNQAANLMGKAGAASTPGELNGLIQPIHELISSIRVLTGQLTHTSNVTGAAHMMEARRNIHAGTGSSLAIYEGNVPSGTLAAMGIGSVTPDGTPKPRRSRNGADATIIDKSGRLIPQYLVEYESEENGVQLVTVPLEKTAADLLQEEYAYERATNARHRQETSLRRARARLLSPVGEIKNPASANRALKYQAFAHAHLQSQQAVAAAGGSEYSGSDLAATAATVNAANQAMQQLQTGALNADRVFNQLNQTANRLLSTIDKIVSKSQQIGVQEAKKIAHGSARQRQGAYDVMHQHTMATQYTGGPAPAEFEKTKSGLERRLVDLGVQYESAQMSGNHAAMAILAGEQGSVAAALRSMQTQEEANRSRTVATQTAINPASNPFFSTPMGSHIQTAQALIDERKNLYADTQRLALSGKGGTAVYANIGRIRSLDRQIQTALSGAESVAGGQIYSSEEHGMARRVAIAGRAFTGQNAERSYTVLEDAVSRGQGKAGSRADRLRIAAGETRHFNGPSWEVPPDVQLQQAVRAVNQAKAQYQNAKARGEDSTAAFAAYQAAVGDLRGVQTYVKGYTLAHAEKIEPELVSSYTRVLGQSDKATAEFERVEAASQGAEARQSRRQRRKSKKAEISLRAAQGGTSYDPGGEPAEVLAAQMNSHIKREKILKKRIQNDLAAGRDATANIDALESLYGDMGKLYAPLVSGAANVSDEFRQRTHSTVRAATQRLDVSGEVIEGYRNRHSRGAAGRSNAAGSLDSQLRDAQFIKNQMELMRNIHSGSIDIRALSSAELAQYRQGFEQARALMRGFSGPKKLAPELEAFFSAQGFTDIVNVLGGSSRRDVPHLFDRTIAAVGGIDSNAPAARAARFVGRFGINESAAFRFFGAFTGNGGPPHPPGFTGPGSPGEGGRYGRRYDTLFNYLNRRVTNLSQLAQTPVYGMGTIGAAAAAIGGSLMLDSEASAQKSVISGMVNSQGTFYDPAGNKQTGMEKFMRAQQESQFIYQGLRKQARESLLTTREMVEFFSGGAGMLTRKGINPDQSTKIIDVIATVGKSLGLQEPAIVSDIRDFSVGRVNAKSQVLNVLGLDQAKLKEAYKTGGGQGAYNYFMKATEGYGYALDDLKNKPISQYNKLLDSLQQLGIEAGAAIYKGFKPGIDELMKLLGNFNSSQVLPRFAQGIGQMMSMSTKLLGGASGHASSLMALGMPTSEGSFNWGGTMAAGVNMLSMAGMYTSGRTLLSSPATLQANNRLIKSIDMQLDPTRMGYGELSQASIDRLHAQRMDATTSRNAAAAAAGDAITSLGVSLAAFVVTARMAADAVTELQTAERKRIEGLSGSLSDPHGLQRTSAFLQNLKNAATANQGNKWAAETAALMSKQAFLEMLDRGDYAGLEKRFGKSGIDSMAKEFGIKSIGSGGGFMGGVAQVMRALGLPTNVLENKGADPAFSQQRKNLGLYESATMPGGTNAVNNYMRSVLGDYILNATGTGFNFADARSMIAADLLARGQITKGQFLQSVDSVVSAQEKNKDAAKKAEILQLAGTLKRDVAGLDDAGFMQYAGKNSNSILKLFSFMFPQYGASLGDKADEAAKKVAPNFGPIIDRLQSMFQATSKYAPDAAQAVLIPALRNYQIRQALGEYRTTVANLDADPSSTDAQRQAALQKYYDSVHGFSLAIEQMTFQVKEASIALKEESAARKAETSILYSRLQSEKASVMYTGLLSYTKDAGAAFMGAANLYGLGLNTANKTAALSMQQAENERQRIIRGAESVKSFSPISGGQPGALSGTGFSDPTGQVLPIDPMAGANGMAVQGVGGGPVATKDAAEKKAYDDAVAQALADAVNDWALRRARGEQVGPMPTNSGQFAAAGNAAVAELRRKRAEAKSKASQPSASLKGGIGKGPGKVVKGGSGTLPGINQQGGVIHPGGGANIPSAYDPTQDTSAAAKAAAGEASANAADKYASDRGYINAQHAMERFSLQRALMGNLQESAGIAARAAYGGDDLQSYIQSQINVAEQGKFAGAAGAEAAVKAYISSVGKNLAGDQSRKFFEMSQSYSNKVAGLYADYNSLPPAATEKDAKNRKTILTMELARLNDEFERELAGEFNRAKEVIREMAARINGIARTAQEIADIVSMSTKEAEMTMEARGEGFLESGAQLAGIKQASQLRIKASMTRARAQRTYEEQQKIAQALIIGGSQEGIIGTASLLKGVSTLQAANKNYLGQLSAASREELTAGMYRAQQSERETAANKLTESIKLLNDEMQRLASQGLNKLQTAIFNLTGEQTTGVEAIKQGYADYVAGGEARKRANILSMTKSYDVRLKGGMMAAAAAMLLPTAFGGGSTGGMNAALIADAMMAKHRGTPGYQQGLLDIEARAASLENAGQRTKLTGMAGDMREALVRDRIAAATSAAFSRMMGATNIQDAITGGIIGAASPYQALMQEQTAAKSSFMANAFMGTLNSQSAAAMGYTKILSTGKYMDASGRMFTSKQLGMRALEDLGMNMVGQLGGQMTSKWFGNQNPEMTQAGISIGGALGPALFAGLGKFGGPVGMIAGGLLGSMFGGLFGGRKDEMDPQEKAWRDGVRKSMNELVDLIRPISDVYKVYKSDVLFGPASFAYSGRLGTALAISRTSGYR